MAASWSSGSEAGNSLSRISRHRWHEGATSVGSSSKMYEVLTRAPPPAVGAMSQSSRPQRVRGAHRSTGRSGFVVGGVEWSTVHLVLVEGSYGDGLGAFRLGHQVDGIAEANSGEEILLVTDRDRVEGCHGDIGTGGSRSVSRDASTSRTGANRGEQSRRQRR
jgi:hypothetical protein